MWGSRLQDTLNDVGNTNTHICELHPWRPSECKNLGRYIFLFSSWGERKRNHIPWDCFIVQRIQGTGVSHQFGSNRGMTDLRE